MYEKIGKPLLDRLFSFLFLILFSPVYLVIALLVRIKLGKPVLFCQVRPGKNEKLFKMYKFRTMTDRRDENGQLLPDKERMTGFGAWLRASSLDELPEMFNILKGDMSLVGPRPLLAEYLERYNEEQKHRHDVKPGLTGLAQVHGRNAITWEEKFRYDCQYAAKITFLGDMKILWKTVSNVLKKEGIQAEGSVTAEKFMGTRKKLIIIGTGGHGRVIQDLALKCGYEIIGFLDDFATEDTVLNIPLLGGTDKAKEYAANCCFVIGIGNNQTRKRIALENPDLKFATLVHPSAVLGDYAAVEPGTVVMAQSVIQPHARVGAHCIINTGAIVEHDNRIGDYVHISPRAALGGTVTIGELTHIGIGAVVRNNIEIAPEVTVGAGAVVVKDIQEAGTYMGVPARKS